MEVAFGLLILRRLFCSPEKIQPLLDLWASYELIELQPFDEVVHAFKVLSCIRQRHHCALVSIDHAQHACGSNE